MTGVGQVRLTIVVLAALAVTVSAAPTPATKPHAPKWHCHFGLHQPKIVAVSTRSIWFRRSLLLWRYDFQTQTTHPFSFMEGFRAGSFSRLTADDSGSFALTDDRNALVLAPGKGWRSLPNWRGDGRLRSMHFGDDGSLLGLRTGQLLRWTGRAWEKIRPFPATVGAARMPKSWLLWDSTTNDQYACDRFRVLADGQQKAKPCPTNQPDGARVTFMGPVLRTRGKTYVYVGLSAKKRGAPRILAAVTPEGLRLLPPKRVWFGIDMTGDGFVKAAIHSREWGSGFYWRVTTPEGKQLPPVLGHGSDIPIVLRDPNGHIWCNANRWDGKEWKRVLPRCAFPYQQQMTLALDGGRFRFDGETGRWRTMAPGVPEDLSCYDPKTRTGWIRRYSGTHRGLLFVRIGKDGKITVLRRIASAPGGNPLFRSPDGNSWWRYNNIIIRVDADGKVHRHSGHARVKRGMENAHPHVVLSPKGNVWMWHLGGYWARFDPKSGQFVRAKPYDEFAFRFGPWMLSVMGERPADYTHNLRLGGEVGQVFRKDKGGWKAMPSPFDPGGLYCTRRMIRGDRMLVTCSLGAFEYDATNDRWAFLHRGQGLVAGFDDAGRRILIAQQRHVLVLDGDPFIAKGDVARAEITTMSRLLRLMDHSDWRVREKATERAKGLGAGCHARLQAALERDDLSLEVRLRIKEVLKDTNTSLSVALPSLFDFMHPPLERIDAQPADIDIAK